MKHWVLLVWWRQSKIKWWWDTFLLDNSGDIGQNVWTTLEANKSQAAGDMVISCRRYGGTGVANGDSLYSVLVFYILNQQVQFRTATS